MNDTSLETYLDIEPDISDAGGAEAYFTLVRLTHFMTSRLSVAFEASWWHVATRPQVAGNVHRQAYSPGWLSGLSGGASKSSACSQHGEAVV